MVKIKDIDKTPNPDEMRVMVDQPLTEGETKTFSTLDEAKGDDLAQSLLEVEHVENIYYVNYHITVKQDGNAPWSDLLKTIAPIIRKTISINEVANMGQDKTEGKRDIKQESSRKRIAQYLREVIDPELGVNIVDLGLIYDIIEQEDKVVINFTATTPGCPMQHYLEQQIKRSVSKTITDKRVESELVWQPSWNIDMMSPELKRHFNPA